MKFHDLIKCKQKHCAKVQANKVQAVNTINHRRITNYVTCASNYFV